MSYTPEPVAGNVLKPVYIERVGAEYGMELSALTGSSAALTFLTCFN